MTDNHEFYHGTSTLFIDSIFKNGLGGVNPNFKFKNIELLKFIYGKCENTLFNEEKYSDLIRETTLAMIRQTDLIIRHENKEDEKLNFRHKEIYVSLSEFKAISYSLSNKIGSEILQRTYDLYQLLIKNKVKVNIPKELNHYGIESLEIEQLKPLLIKTKSIQKNHLIQENGLDGEEFINELNKYYPIMSEKDKFINFQYMNFGLKRPVAIQHKDVYEIRHTGSINDRNFKYKLVNYFS